MNAARRVLTADAAPVEVVRARVPGPPVVVVEAGIVPRVVLPLIVVVLGPMGGRLL